ncbi:hypothetical protein [Microcoleus sp. B13-B4]|uniref:hypothetical protein n=1 Tax=Microcoleus sp. B13-B4 TaxID=2818651 RepID=UPI002FD2DBB4
MARGFSKAVISQQKQTDSWHSMNILNASFLEHFANLKDPRIERSKEHLLKDTAISRFMEYGCKGLSTSLVSAWD